MFETDQFKTAHNLYPIHIPSETKQPDRFPPDHFSRRVIFAQFQFTANYRLFMAAPCTKRFVCMASIFPRYNVLIQSSFLHG